MAEKFPEQVISIAFIVEPGILYYMETCRVFRSIHRQLIMIVMCKEGFQALDPY